MLVTKKQVLTSSCCSHVSAASTSISTFQSFLPCYFMLISFFCIDIWLLTLCFFLYCRTNPLLILFLIQMVCML